MQRIALALLLFGSLATTALAQEDQGPPRPMHRAHDLLALDTNYDGAVSRQEYMANAEAVFARLDRNHDQVLDQHDRPPMWDGPRDGPPRARGPHPSGEERGIKQYDRERPLERPLGRPFGGPRWGDRFLGPITRAEFLARAAQRFARLDANHNGRLSGDELESFGPPEDERPFPSHAPDEPPPR